MQSPGSKRVADLRIDTARFRDPKKIGEFFIWWKNKNPYMLVPKQILSVLKVTRFHLQMNPPFFFQWKNHRNTNIFFKWWFPLLFFKPCTSFILVKRFWNLHSSHNSFWCYYQVNSKVLVHKFWLSDQFSSVPSNEGFIYSIGLRPYNTFTNTLQIISYIYWRKKTCLSFYKHVTKIYSNCAKLNFQNTAAIDKI